MPQWVEHQTLTQYRQDSDHRGRTGHGNPVVRAQVHHEKVGHECPDHVERAMGEIGDMKYPVDQGEAQGYETVDTPQG